MQREAGSRAWRRAQEEPFVVLLDFGLGQRVEIGEDFGPGPRLTEVGDAILQLLLQHKGEKAARHVTSDRFVELVEDRACGEKTLRCAEGLTRILRMTR